TRRPALDPGGSEAGAGKLRRAARGCAWMPAGIERDDRGWTRARDPDERGEAVHESCWSGRRVSPGATRVLIVADSSVVAATIEAALRQTPGLCIAVGHRAALARLIEEHEPAVVILASRAARVAPTLEAVADRIRVPPVIVVVDDPRAAWTSAARRAGAYAVL